MITRCFRCTNPSFYGCERSGQGNNIINPTMAARLRTVNSFAFKYGKVEIRAKMPSGDWLWPAIWLLPQRNAYGPWPASGEVIVLNIVVLENQNSRWHCHT